MRYLIVCLCLISAFCSAQQSGKSDSKQDVSTNSSLVAAKNLVNNGDNDSALVVLAMKPETSYNYYNIKAEALYRIGLYDSAIMYTNLALEFINPSDSFDLFLSLNRLGLIHDKSGEFDKSLEYLFRSHDLISKSLLGLDSNNYKIQLSRLNLRIGSVLDAIGEVKRALHFYDKYLLIRKELSDSMGIARAYNNIGIIYKNLEKYDSAIMFYDLAQSYINNQDRELSWRIITNVGNLLKRIENHEEAEKYYIKAIDLALQGDNKTQISDSYYNFASFWFTMNDYSQCENYFKKALEISLQTNSAYELYYIHGSLSELYAAWDKPAKALEQLLKSNEYRDVLYKEEKEKAIAETLTKYETEKKEQQIALQAATIAEQKAQNQRNLFGLISLAVIVLLLTALVLLNKSRSKKQQHLLILEAQQVLKEAEIAATISSQEKERSRFAKDLHDGFGQMISILNLNLKSLEKSGSNRNEIFENSSQVLEEMYQELKSICFNLMPQTLIKHGISAAINEFAARINAADQVHVETDFFGLEERLSEVQEISIYRITQEWVNNLIKYSDASKVTIQLTQDENEITLMIEDNGMGFELELLKSGTGNGWRNMNSRANLIKGDLEVDTTPGIRGNTMIVNASLITEVVHQP